MQGTTLGRKYEVGDVIGYGKFGVVYKGKHIERGDPVAIKTEDWVGSFRILRHEVTVLSYLASNNVRNIPLVYWFGPHMRSTCLVMSYYTCSLEDYIVRKGTMDQRKLGSLMIKCICILESIHKHDVLHRDIKPGNFMVRDGELFLIDFGLSSILVDGDGVHVRKNSPEHITGTPKYVSYFNHCGEFISRRDDMLSLGYMYLYIRYGKLPWSDSNIVAVSDLPATSVLHPRNVELKMSKSWDNLSSCTSIDHSIRMFFKYCYELKYDDVPNYHIIMELFVV